MKKLLINAVAVCLCSGIFAGGIVTNTNQSASWVRLPSQDASIEISSVFFNPAGLMKLNNGFHISVSNQTILQNREIQNTYKGPAGLYGLNDSIYTGKVFAPVFPSVYAVYKMDKIAFSFGFNPIGGGGGATFDKGLPSFELSASDLVPSLASQGVSDYRLDAYFKGSSIYFGYQGGISYKISENFSVYGGLRYVTAKNTYEGHLNDIELNMGGNWLRADAVFGGIVNKMNSLLAAPGSLQPIVDGGGGSLTLAQAETATYLTTQQRTDLEAGLAYIGLSAGSIAVMNINTIQGAFNAAAPTLTATKLKSIATGKLLRDQSADVDQTGSGMTPIIGMNITYGKLNIGIKYEFVTKMNLTNKTNKDFTTGYLANGDSVTMFPDGEETPNDMPAMLSVGVSAKVTNKLTINAGTHLYFDKSVSYGKKINNEFVTNNSVMDKNYVEVSTGIEYNITDKLLVSTGYLYAKSGVNHSYQSDLSYSLTSNTFGGGGAYKINDKIQINAGVGYSIYDKDEKWSFHKFSATGQYYSTKEIYYKDNIFVSVGVDLSF